MGVPLQHSCVECGKMIDNGANGITDHFAGEDPAERQEVVDRVCPAMVCRAAAHAIHASRTGFPGMTGEERKRLKERLPAIKATFRRLTSEAERDGRSLILTPAPVV